LFLRPNPFTTNNEQRTRLWSAAVTLSGITFIHSLIHSSHVDPFILSRVILQLVHPLVDPPPGIALSPRDISANTPNTRSTIRHWPCEVLQDQDSVDSWLPRTFTSSYSPSIVRRPSTILLPQRLRRD
jgi:hypothetical protein